MAGQKHKPQRTCIGCREVKYKREMIRLVRTPAGEVIIDPTGKANGRGIYLCRQLTCWDKGLKKERLAQSLKVNLSPEEVTVLRDALQSELSKA